MVPLPIDARIPEILESLSRSCSIVVSAPPGSGKTTRLPPAILEAGLIARDQAVVVLQPRRAAARAIASRIAAERGWSLGREVGWHVRHDRNLGPHTRLRIVTEGILTRTLAADPFLAGISAVVIDEFHERSIHADLALAMLREIQNTVRDDLFIIVMSATLDAQPVSRHLGDCPICVVEGKPFPVAIEHRFNDDGPIVERVAREVQRLLSSRERTGDILVFLPGAGEIERVGRAIAAAANESGALVLPLHGGLSLSHQIRAIEPDREGRAKVVLATNIAETSLTIEGVSTVIDTGLARVASVDQTRGIERLELAPISKAAADQRAGRAGRTGPGLCVRLWTERDHRMRADFETPEIARADLAATVLLVHALGHRDLPDFAWFEEPPRASLEAAERLLILLGALDPDTRAITPEGSALANIPAHPRIGKLLLESARRGIPQAGAALAAILSEEDFLTSAFDPRANSELRSDTSDILVRRLALEHASRCGFSRDLPSIGIDPDRARRADRARQEYERIATRLARRANPPETLDEAELLKLVLFAYPDRVARRRGPRNEAAVMVGGRGVRLDPRSVVTRAEYFVAIDPLEGKRGGTLEARVRLASALDPEWLESLLPQNVRKLAEIGFDSARGRVTGVRKLMYLDLMIREDQGVQVEGDVAGVVLAKAIAESGSLAWLREDPEAAAWLDRLAWLRSIEPGTPWPELDAKTADEIVATACAGKSSQAEVRARGLVGFLEETLDRTLQSRLRTQAPERITLPGGAEARLTYSSERPPLLRARVQELFGWRETPKIAGAPILLEILAPNQRPVQLTTDLASFWKVAYFQVRKDLRGRYPKHAWPEDPLQAPALPRKRGS